MSWGPENWQVGSFQPWDDTYYFVELTAMFSVRYLFFKVSNESLQISEKLARNPYRLFSKNFTTFSGKKKQKNQL